jgi:hypothetical protein
VLRKKLTLPVAMALMLAMMLANAGMASAANGTFNTGASHANAKTSGGIATAIAHGAPYCGSCE